MNYRIFKLIALIITLSAVFTLSVNADDLAPLAVGDIKDIEINKIGEKTTPSQAFLNSNRRTVSAETDLKEVRTLASPARTPYRAADIYGLQSWGEPELPGDDGWETGPGGNVGYPLGDASLPILLSMLILYFLYRGVSSSKRKSNF